MKKIISLALIFIALALSVKSQKLHAWKYRIDSLCMSMLNKGTWTDCLTPAKWEKVKGTLLVLDLINNKVNIYLNDEKKLSIIKSYETKETKDAMYVELDCIDDVNQKTNLLFTYYAWDRQNPTLLITYPKAKIIYFLRME